MRKNFSQFLNKYLKNFGEFVINIFIFLPYFFSVSTLLKTLFQPWRNLVTKKVAPGFTFNEWANRLAFNLISRGMGFIMRSSIISFYFIFQALFMILLPFASLFYFFLAPIFYFISISEKPDEEKKQLWKNNFLSAHLLKEENRKMVETWFEDYYLEHLKTTKWWKLPYLMSFPPLARDWAVGYTPILDEYAQDLATSSYLHHIKNIVNREKEIDEIERTLSKSAEANVVIVGEEGVGKHTIVDALAKKIYLGKTNPHLMYRRILKLNMEKILTRYVDQKQRENFFEELLEEASQSKNVVLLIDGLDKYLDLSGSIEKYAKTDLIQIIGITTPFAYQRFIFTNEKINRLFDKIEVIEVSEEEAEKILLKSVYEFERRYKIIIPYETVREIIEKSQFYITYIPFPEKAVDLLDTACVFATSGNFGTRGSRLSRETSVSKITSLTPEIINNVLTEKTHIPTSINTQMKEKLLNLESLLKKNIIQQEEAISKLSTSLRRSFLLIGKRKKPLATFLFLGPTGVGKTETAKAVANIFFSSTNSNHLIRFDMSNFQSKYDIPKLIGNIDTNEPGLLTKAIREQPYGVLLLDEIEKADRDLLNIFLSILDEGYYTDGTGHHVDCKNLVIIATSNAGAEFLWNKSEARNTKHETNSNVSNLENSNLNIVSNFDIRNSDLLDYLIDNKVFTPEFLNRFDGVIVYQLLKPESLKLVAKKILDSLEKDLYQLYKVKIKISEQTIDSLVEKGYEPRFGARNLERVIRDEIEDKISKLVLENKAKEGSLIFL